MRTILRKRLQKDEEDVYLTHESGEHITAAVGSESKLRDCFYH